MQLNGYKAYIITIEDEKSFPKRSQMIKEYGLEVKGSTATCYIPVTAGSYFAAWWWAEGQQINEAYSAEFIRDGESVVHLVFSSEDAAEIAGIAGEWHDDETRKRWNFQFRNIKCTGKDDSTTLGKEIGRLELIIRRLHESDLQDSGSDSSGDCMSDGPSTFQQRVRKLVASPSDEENSEDGEENSEENGEENGEDDSEDDEPEDSDDPDYGRRAVRRGAKAKGATRNRTTTEFTKIKNVKPRQTHSADLVKFDGTRFKGRIEPLRSMPKGFIGDDKDVIAKFVFYYTSAAKVKLLTKPSSRTTQSNDTARARKRVRRNSPETGIHATPVPIPIKTENGTDEKYHFPLQTGRSGQDNNFAGPSSSTPVKTEPENHENQAEINKIDEAIKALKAQRRTLRQGDVKTIIVPPTSDEIIEISD